VKQFAWIKIGSGWISADKLKEQLKLVGFNRLLVMFKVKIAKAFFPFDPRLFFPSVRLVSL